MSTAVTAGQTDVSLYYYAWNESDGSKADDIAFDTEDLFIGYTREREEEVFVQEGESTEPVELVDQDSAHTDWGFIRVNRNLYRVDFPDEAFASGVKFVAPVVEAPGVTFVMAPLVDIAASDLRAAKVAATIAAGDIATDAITDDVLAANAVTEIQNGLATSAEVGDLPTLTEIIAAEIAALDGLSNGATTVTINGVSFTVTRTARDAISTMTAD